jgi:RNA polymerase sigma-70 factor (ECF subfamily)
MRRRSMLKRKTGNKEHEDTARSIEEICVSTWESVYRYIYFKVQNREEAEDITQETYARALSFLRDNQLREGPHLGFLRSVALNVLRDRWRRKKRIGPIVSIYGTESNMAVDDIAEQSAIRSMVREALDCLTQEHRTVIELRILKGFSTAETAEIMNKKEGTVRVILYRALKKLAEKLDANY